MNVKDIMEAQGKENIDISNKMRSYQDDPLLKEFDEAEKEAKNSDGEDKSESSEESSEEEQLSDIKFPKENAQDLLQFIMRDLNNLQNKDEKQKRKFSLLRLYEIFVLARNKAHNSIY